MKPVERGKKLSSDDLIPRHGSTEELRGWIRNRFGFEMPCVWKTELQRSEFVKNIENYIGTAQLPIGIAGPVFVRGRFANGFFYVPFATTEGLLVDSYNRGMLAVSQAGGVEVKVMMDRIDISPLFILSDESVESFLNFIEGNQDSFKKVVKTKTSHGNLIKCDWKVIDLQHVIVTFYFSTGDAMGLNMINVATDEICRFIRENFSIRGYYLRSNFSSDKKVSYHNFMSGYGKSVLAKAVLPAAIIKNYLGTDIEKLYDFWHWSFLASQQSGIMGINAQFANGLSAIYVATGQDVAQVVNASSGTTVMDKDGSNLIVTVRLPSLVVGTYGGGTRLPTQAECLKLMGCLEVGDVSKFAEIVAAAILCGEISICAALSAGVFAKAHDMKRKK